MPYVPAIKESTTETIPYKSESSNDKIFFRRTNHEPRQKANKGPDSPGSSSLTKTKKKSEAKGKKNKKKSSFFKWPWSKKKDDKKIEIEVLPETFVHLDGFAGLRGQVQQSQSVGAKLSGSFTSKQSSTSKVTPVQSLVRTSQDRLSTASNHRVCSDN